MVLSAINPRSRVSHLEMAQELASAAEQAIRAEIEAEVLAEAERQAVESQAKAPLDDPEKDMLRWERAAISRSTATIEFYPDGTIQTANDNFCAATGYALEEIQGKHHRIFCTKEYANSPDYALLWQRLAQGEHFTSRAHRVRKDGSDIWIEATYYPITDDDGKVVKVMKLAHDVTALVLRDAEASQTAFAASQRSDKASTAGQERVDEAVQAIRQSAEAIAEAQDSVKQLGENPRKFRKW